MEKAAALDREARHAFEKGSFEEAAAKFAEAYRVAPHPATLYNEAMAWDRGKRLARAADAYTRALDEKGLDEARAEAARSRLEELRSELAVLRILEPVGAKAAVAYLKDATVPCTVFLMPGSHDVMLTRTDGTTARRTVDAKAGQTVELVIEVAEAPKAPGEPEPRRPAPRVSEVEPERDDGSTATWGWIALGTAAAFSGVAIYTGVQTLSARDDFEASDRLSADDRDRALKYRTFTNVAWGAAAITGAVGGVLLLSSGGGQERDAPPSTAVRLTPVGAEATWTF